MKFSEVQVGNKFKTAAGVVMVKIEPERVSCCRANNAMNLDNLEKTMIRGDEEVEAVE
jgi:hypothetical protein